MRPAFSLFDPHNQNILPLILLALFLHGLWSCSQTTGRGAGEGNALSETKAAQQVSGDYRSGEVLVKFRDGILEVEIEKIARSENLEIMKILSGRLYLFRITSTSNVEDTIGALKKRKEVEYAEPNYIHRLK